MQFYDFYAKADPHGDLQTYDLYKGIDTQSAPDCNVGHSDLHRTVTWTTRVVCSEHLGK